MVEVVGCSDGAKIERSGMREDGVFDAVMTWLIS